MPSVATSKPQTISYPHPGSRPSRHDDYAADPHVVVLFGATGDLARRKLIPGLAYLDQSDLAPHIQIVATSLEDISTEEFLELAKEAIEEFGTHKLSKEQWAQLLRGGHLCAAERRPRGSGKGRRRSRGQARAGSPSAALPLGAAEGRPCGDHHAADANLVDRSRVVMEKPFGTDLASAVELNGFVHETFDEKQIFRIDHFLGKEAAQNILAFRFANGLFEPIWNRNFIDHIQIDIPETLGLDQRANFYESTGAYKDMVVTHLVPGDGVRRDGTADRAGTACDQRGEEQGVPVDAAGELFGRRPRPVRRLPRQRRCGKGFRYRDVHRTQGGHRQLALGRSADLPAHGKADGRGHPDHLHRVQGGTADDVSRPDPASAHRVPTTSRSTSPTIPRCRCPSTASGPVPA